MRAHYFSHKDQLPSAEDMMIAAQNRSGGIHTKRNETPSATSNTTCSSVEEKTPGVDEEEPSNSGDEETESVEEIAIRENICHPKVPR